MKFLKTGLVLSFIFICLSTKAHAQEANDREAIKSTIKTFFEGMHTGDTIKVMQVVVPDVIMETTFVNQEGNSVKRTVSLENFLKAVASKNPDEEWFEKLLGYEIHIDQPLASVWTPYEFYINGRLSHCGANSFQLFKNEGRWQIIYLVDSRKQRGCEPE